MLGQFVLNRKSVLGSLMKKMHTFELGSTAIVTEQNVCIYLALIF